MKKTTIMNSLFQYAGVLAAAGFNACQTECKIAGGFEVKPNIAELLPLFERNHDVSPYCRLVP